MTETAVLPHDVVNSEVYPIGDPAGARRAALVERCRAELDANMYCVLPEFVRPGALAMMAAEAAQLRPQANDNSGRRNCYLQRRLDPAFDDQHPRNLLTDSCTRLIAADLIPSDSPLRALYEDEGVRMLVADIVGDEPLFENADPYQPLNYVCYEEGDQSSWHFDSVNAFTMTLMVQASDVGGDFQISPNTRADDDQNFEHVRQVLTGERDDTIVSVAREPGALCLFRGCNSLHRVSPVGGPTMRMMGVLVYETEPGVLGDPEVNETIYGSRVTG
jgi:hypothetical protein